MNEFKNDLTHSIGFRILVFSVALFVCVLTALVVIGVLGQDENIVMLKLGQGIGSTVWYVVPPVILYVVTRNQPMFHLGFRKPARVWMLLIGVVLMFISLPITNLLTDWNERVNLGEWAGTMEDSAADLTERMLAVNTVGELLFNLVVIALIPAVGEELTFRGVLQQALTKGCKNAHVAIAISAAVFSFIHFQFYGFLPRMFLGLLLGYLFYYSGSIWTSILMHFFNNGSVVVLYYLNTKGLVNVDVDHFGSTDNVFVLVASLVLTVGSIFLVSKNQYKYGK